MNTAEQPKNLNILS